MTEPNTKYLSDDRVPVVSLGGKRWPMPKLAPRQNEVLLPMFSKGKFQSVTIDTMTSEVLRELGTIVFLALQRGHYDFEKSTGLTREEFDDMPIDVFEMLAAMPVIMQQTGVYSAKPNGVASGEVAGPSQTGTP